MKNVKKILIIMLISALSLAVFSCKKIENDNKTKENNILAFVNFGNIGEAFEDSLKEKYGTNYKEVFEKNISSTMLAQKITQIIKSDVENDNEYPDYYGGIYINDMQELVLQIKKDLISKSVLEKYNNYNNILKKDEKFNIEYVNNSFNDLVKINDLVDIAFKLDSNIVAHRIDEFSNKVIVELKNNSLSEQEKFKKNVIDSNAVVLIEGKPLEYTSFSAGENLSKVGCSLSYRAKLNGTAGFITAGHCARNVELNNDFYGYGTLVKKQHSGTVDAAFIKTSTVIENKLKYDIPAYPPVSMNATANPFFVSGSIVGSSSAESGGKVGIITSINDSYSILLNPFTEEYEKYNDMVATDIVIKEGDSGGIVISADTSSKIPVYARYAILGVISCKDKNNLLKFSKTTNIEKVLGVNRY